MNLSPFRVCGGPALERFPSQQLYMRYGLYTEGASCSLLYPLFFLFLFFKVRKQKIVYIFHKPTD
jgi:hypothetical protein